MSANAPSSVSRPFSSGTATGQLDGTSITTAEGLHAELIKHPPVSAKYSKDTAANRLVQQKLQAKVAALGLTDKKGVPIQVPQNGVIDANTVAAIKAVQGKMGLEPDGVVGNQTWAMLYNTPTALMPHPGIDLLDTRNVDAADLASGYEGIKTDYGKLSGGSIASGGGLVQNSELMNFVVRDAAAHHVRITCTDGDEAGHAGVGHAENSRHYAGLAVDLGGQNADLLAVQQDTVAYAASNNLKIGELIGPDGVVQMDHSVSAQAKAALAKEHSGANAHLHFALPRDYNPIIPV